MNDLQGLPSATFRQVFTLQDYQAIIDELKQENENLSVNLDAALTRLRYALAALEAVEWVSDPTPNTIYDECPWCFASIRFHGKHKPDCLRQLALAMPPEVGEK